MQNASNLNIGENPSESYVTTANNLWQLFVGFEDLRLSTIYPRGTVVFAQGQPAERLCLLRTGRAKVSLSSSEGKTAILRVAQPGALLGVNSVLQNVPYDVSVETLEQSRIDFVSRSEFVRFFEKSEATRVGVAQILAGELSDTVERMRSLLLSQSAAEKLAILLLKWCEEQGEAVPEGTRLNPGLTHEEIAQMICTSRETVTRLFAELRRKQIVRFTNSTTLVCDRKALEASVRDRESAETS